MLLKKLKTAIWLTIGLTFLMYQFSSGRTTPTASELQLSIKKLATVGNVLYIGAHPDDENTALLAYLANERMLRSAYLSLTRGDGGQNLLGSEQGELFGVIRTQELLAARRIDGAEQFFTRAIDFGYSKSADETLAIWGKEDVLSDMVWVIRQFRPDVIISRFPANGDGGHGHHTASAILAVEAFKAGADPNRFPEQLSLVKPWQAKRIFWNAWRPDNQQTAGLLGVDVGLYNPLLGRSYTEIAGESRSMHKSQGFGSAERRGSRMEFFQLLAGEPAVNDIMEGVCTTWERVDGAAALTAQFQNIYDHFQTTDPAASLPALLEALKAMDRLPANPWLPYKRQQLQNVIQQCAGLWLEAVNSDYSACPGTRLQITANAVNRSDYPLTLDKLHWSFTQHDTLINKPLLNNQPVEVKFTLDLPKQVPTTQPYWLREKASKGLYRVSDQKLIGLAGEPPPVSVDFIIAIPDGNLSLSVPVQYRWTDPVEGDLYRPLVICPPVSINLSEPLYLFPANNPRTLQLTVKNNLATCSGELSLDVSQGWSVKPSRFSFSFSKKEEETVFAFQITPPQQEAGGLLQVQAQVGDQIVRTGTRTVQYSHFPPQTLFPPAETKLIRLALQPPTERIGYIMGAGDEIPVFLRQLGYTVELLDDESLSQDDLSQFQVLITGVRAYNTRTRLGTTQARLMQFVSDGGTLIVQYNNNGRLVVDNIGPYPLRLSRDRVTVEEAPVTLLLPDHPLLNKPFKIVPADFQGWIQERGLYFSDQWDGQYQAILSCQDPGEQPKNGGMLYARYGKGVFIYSAYAWFRQLPAGVPGAYHLFVNMIEAGKP
jgi:LmbE family N-acetylglucosaminyl deacetylase